MTIRSETSCSVCIPHPTQCRRSTLVIPLLAMVDERNQGRSNHPLYRLSGRDSTGTCVALARTDRPPDPGRRLQPAGYPARADCVSVVPHREGTASCFPTLGGEPAGDSDRPRKPPTYRRAGLRPCGGRVPWDFRTSPSRSETR